MFEDAGEFSETVEAEDLREQKRLDQDVRAIITWANTYLKQRSCTATSIETDFRDGVRLIVLCEIAFNVKIGHYNLRPKLAFHRLDNLAIAFKFCSENNVSLLNIDPHSIMDGAVKPTLILFRSLLRALTLKGLEAMSSTISSQTSHKPVRTQLLEWVSQTFAHDFGDVPVENFWSSFADGVAFCALVESLVPGSINMSSLRSQSSAENLALAFSIAEEKLGIPSVLKPEDFVFGVKSDEAAVEQYISMLVSAAAGNRKRDELAQEQIDIVKAKKEKEVEQLKSQMLENEKRVQLMMEANEIAVSKEKMLQDQRLNDELALSEYQEKYNLLVENNKKTHELMKTLSRSEEDLRSRVAEFEKIIEQKDEQAAELQIENTRLNSEIYAMHIEAMDTQLRFQTEEASHQEERQFTDSSKTPANGDINSKTFVVGQKLHSDIFSSIPPRKGWLMLRKIGGSFFTKPKSKKRYFELRGDCLYHSAKKGTPVASCTLIKLSCYQKIEFESDVVDLTEDFNQLIRSDPISTVSSDVDRVLHLVPKPWKPSLNSYEIASVQSFESELKEDISVWIQEITDRIALIDYLKDLESSRRHPCRELIDFIADPSRNLLTICDRVQDFCRALVHFKESLIMRANLAIILENVAVSNQSLDILGEVISRNNSIRLVELPRNQITALDIAPIASALKINRSLQELCLCDNQIKDEGVALLAEAISSHPRLRVLRLSGNSITCEGAIALCQGIQASSDRHNWEHEFPCIELTQNCIGDKGAAAIADLLRVNKTITRIRLSRNVISDSGIVAISAALSANPRRIEEILLAHNQLTSRGIIVLADALEHVKTPHIIDLSRNQMIGRSGITRLLQVDIPIKFEGFTIVRGVVSGERGNQSRGERRD